MILNRVILDVLKNDLHPVVNVMSKGRSNYSNRKHRNLQNETTCIMKRIVSRNDSCQLWKIKSINHSLSYH